MEHVPRVPQRKRRGFSEERPRLLFSSNGTCTSGVRCLPGNDGQMHHQAANTSSASPSAVLAPDPLVTVTARTASCGAWTMQGTSLEEG